MRVFRPEPCVKTYAARAFPFSGRINVPARRTEPLSNVTGSVRSGIRRAVVRVPRSPTVMNAPAECSSTRMRRQTGAAANSVWPTTYSFSATGNKMRDRPAGLLRSAKEKTALQRGRVVTPTVFEPLHWGPGGPAYYQEAPSH